MGDMDIDGARLPKIFVAPNKIEQLVAGKYTILMVNERDQ